MTLAEKREKEKRIKLLQLQRQKILMYQRRPDLWFSQRWGEPLSILDWTLHDPEKYATHKWDGTENPILSMFMGLANHEWVGVEAATSVGKTFSMVRAMYWFLDVYEDAQVIITAPRLAQVRDQFFGEVTKCAERFKGLKPDAEFYSARIQVYDSDDSRNSWRAFGTTAGVGAGEESAVKLQGIHATNLLFIVDEATGVSPAVYKAIENTSTAKNNLILACGNPDNVTDPLHKFCTKKRVRHVRISAYDFPNVVLGQDVIAGAVTQFSIDSRRDEYGENSNMFKSRVKGESPRQAMSALVSYDQIMRCYDVPVELTSKSFNACGIDVANSENGDMAAVALGRSGVLCFLKEFQCPNANHIAYNLVKSYPWLMSNPDYKYYGLPTLTDYGIMQGCVGVDAVGVGASTVNAFYNLYWRNIASIQGGAVEAAYKLDYQGKPLYEFAEIWSQMYYELAEDLIANRINWDHEAIPRNIVEKFAEEMSVRKIKMSKGKIKLVDKKEAKQILGRSPNLADAVAVWNFVRKGHFVKY